MTIKAIKAMYDDGSNKFAISEFDAHGKCVVVMNVYFGEKSVTHIVRVSDGVDLIPDRARACDNLSDAVDVADEMLRDAERD